MPRGRNRLEQYSGDKQDLVGILAASIAYGVVLQLFANCIRAVRRTDGVYNQKMRRFLYGYLIGTLFLATAAYMQEAVSLVLLYQSPSWPELVGLGGIPEDTSKVNPFWAALNLQNGTPLALPFAILNADSFMTWRCMVLYNSASHGMRIFAYAVLVLNLFTIIVNIGIFFAGPDLLAGPLALAVVTLITNALLALLITLRILHHQQSIKQVLGTSHSSIYNRVITISVESCALIVLCSAAYLALLSCYRDLSVIPLDLLPQICAISPLFVIMRVAQGRAVTVQIEYSLQIVSAAQAQNELDEENISVPDDAHPSIFLPRSDPCRGRDNNGG